MNSSPTVVKTPLIPIEETAYPPYLISSYQTRQSPPEAGFVVARIQARCKRIVLLMVPQVGGQCPARQVVERNTLPVGNHAGGQMQVMANPHIE